MSSTEQQNKKPSSVLLQSAKNLQKNFMELSHDILNYLETTWSNF